MKALRFALVGLVRDWKSGELAVLFVALLVAVTALTAVGFFTDRIGQAMTQQAGEVLAADLRLEAGRPLDPAYRREGERRGLATAETISLASVVLHGEASSLASVHAVDEGYPLRGRVRIADEPFGAARVAEGIPGPGEVWADAKLLARLDAPVGGELAIGTSTFRVTHVIDYRPDQGSGFLDLAPSVLMNVDDVEATGLLQPGTRAEWGYLFAGAPPQVTAFETWLEKRRRAGERLKDVGEASDQIKSAMNRAGRFLNLAALATILLAGIAVAMAARRYASRHLDNVALMKCMGASQGFVLRVTVLQLVIVALLGALVGIALGWLAQAGLAVLVRDLLDAELPRATATPAALGVATALTMLVGFALPPLLRLRRVPPARVLRRNLEPPRPAHAVTYGLAAAALVGVLFWLVRDARLVTYVAVGVVVTALALYATGWVLVKLTGRLRGGAGVAWRYGLANVARRGTESSVQIVAFGLGLTVLLLLAVVRADLLEDWRASLPADAPNHFLINIPPDAAEPLRAFFVERGVREPELAPWVRARLVAIDGRPVRDMKFATDRGRAFAEREQNLSWAAEVPLDNRVVEGRWWDDPDPSRPLVSIATEFRDELGIRVGDRLTFDVAGETVDAEVANVREVRWDGFRPNFFIVFSPGVLDSATGTFMTSVHLAPGQRPIVADLIRRFPSVTVFDVERLIQQVRGVMDRAALAVQAVFLFTLVAGVVVLLAAVQSTRDERRYESAMLRTLGASRGTVQRGVAAEFVALGLLSGLLGAAAASVAGWVLATRLFNLKYEFDPLVWLAGLVAGALLVGLAGVLATRSVVRTPPAATLRQG